MGYLDDSKITSTDVSAVHVGMQPDRLTGTVAENKQAFDNYPDMIRAKINAGYNVISAKDATQDTRLTAIEAHETDWDTAVTAATNAANTATSNANTATSAVNIATANANTATAACNTATSNANTATGNASTATAACETATGNANNATSAATSATAAANTATGNANTATAACETATEACTTATNACTSATSSCETATTAANNAKKYCIIRYSANADGTDFHADYTTADKYMGVCVNADGTVPTDKTGYAWARFRGEDGQGSGDMLKSVYDTNDDGIVDKATADASGNTITSTYATQTALATANSNIALKANSADVINSLASKANKASHVSATMSASAWSNNQYSFESEYPIASYDIEIEPVSTITVDQLKAWSKAQIVGDNDSNVATAIGTVPTIDIPIIIKVVAL